MSLEADIVTAPCPLQESYSTTPPCCNRNLQRVLSNSGMVITVLSSIAVLLNVGILAVYWKARRLLTPQYLAIINVVVSDLCSAIVGVTFRGPGMLHPTMYYGGSACSSPATMTEHVTTFCLWSPYLAWAFAYQNACAIAILSLDRFFAITFPFWYKVVITKTRARRITYVTWGSVTSYLVLHFTLFWTGYTTVVWVPSDGRCMYRTKSDPASESWQFKIIEDSIFFIFPFMVTVVCYIFILAKLIKSHRKKQQIYGVQRKPLCLTMCIVVTSCIPWILYLISNYQHFAVKHINVMIMSYVFFYVSPIVNPIIFSTRSRTFHAVLWDKLRSKTKKKQSFVKRYLKQQARSSSTSGYGRSSSSRTAVSIRTPVATRKPVSTRAAAASRNGKPLVIENIFLGSLKQRPCDHDAGQGLYGKTGPGPGQ